MELMSPVFLNNQVIPKKYTCDSDDVSPPLTWRDAPKDTKSFVLIVDDPDAPSGTWDHWIVFNIPGDITLFSENVRILPGSAKVGINSWGKLAYGGPCPPSGTHRYFFKLYALNTLLSIDKKPTKENILNAMRGHVLSEAHLIGKYQRS